MENSKLNALLNSENLAEIIAQPTIYRSESSQLQEDFQEISTATDFDEFEPEPIYEEPDPQPRQIAQPEKPYDPEKNAKAMVYSLQAIEALVLNPIAIFKHRKTAGGKEILAKMKAAFDKTNLGEELSEQDERLSTAYEKYKKEMLQLSDELSWGEAKISELIKVAIPYCQDKHFEMNSGTAFWMTYGSQLAGKITKILLK